MCRTAALTLSLFVAGLGACGQEAAPALPEGTVMLLDGVPVTAAEVDEVAAGVGELHTIFSLPQRRRAALLEVLLPRLYALRGNEAARAEALERAREFHAQALAADDPSDLPPVIETQWRSIGVDVWLAVHGLETGAWSEPLEIPGGFAVARIVDRDHAAKAVEEKLWMNLEIFSWLPERGQLTWDMRAGHLRIVDPAWEDVIPASWKYAMTGGDE